MPITKSAKKALRQSKTRRVGNLKRINSYKDAVKKFKKLITAGEFDQAAQVLPSVYQSVDKAAKSGVIKKNKASRLKSATSLALAKKTK